MCVYSSTLWVFEVSLTRQSTISRRLKQLGGLTVILKNLAFVPQFDHPSSKPCNGHFFFFFFSSFLFSFLSRAFTKIRQTGHGFRNTLNVNIRINRLTSFHGTVFRHYAYRIGASDVAGFVGSCIPGVS